MMSRSAGSRSPDDQPGRGAFWTWLQERLFERRILLLPAHLDERTASEVAAALMTLDATADAPIDLYVENLDATLDAAFTVIDTIAALRATIRVHCRGSIVGPAIGIIAVADRRTATAHARFRFAQPTAQFVGTPDQIASQSAQQQALLWRFYALLAQVTGNPPEDIADDTRRGRPLEAREALDYGLVQEISSGSRP